MLSSNQVKDNKRKYKYKKLSLSNDSDIDEGSYVELQNRSLKRHPNASSDAVATHLDYDTVLEKPIQQGESLASISLKYRIPVSELKRANRLHKDAEFYALNCLKIPVKSNSTLHEMLTEELNSVTDDLVDLQESEQKGSGSSATDSGHDAPFGVISIEQICREKSTRKEARQFLENMQNDLKELREKCCPYKGSLEEVATRITSPSFTPMDHKFLECSGADWGCSWWRILAVAALVVIGVPLVYLLVYYR